MNTKIIPRGIRNNNPLNIRIGNTWLGERPNPSDPLFEEFVSLEYGLRAAFCILRRYIRRYRRNTISTIIETWAPVSENDTMKYIDRVSSMLSLSPLAPIDYADKVTMCRLVDAMACVEVGKHLDMRKVEKAYDMA